MRIKQLFLILALLCAIVQMSWAQNFDVWDGHTVKEPRYYTPYQSCHGVYNCIEIKTAAELAWLQEYYTTEYISFEWYDSRSSMYCRSSLRYAVDVVLTADLDMTAVKWEPIGFNKHSHYEYPLRTTFYGNGHTIRLNIDGHTGENYQGLFAVNYGTVKDLHIDGVIKVDNMRLVGGICGYNTGTIENCWVSANVESNHWNVYHYADLGGVCGWNNGTVKYCCMTGNVKNTAQNAGVGGIVGSNYGTVQHCTFYGDVSVDYTQNNKYVGYQTKTMENCFDVFDQGEYDAAGGKGLYRRAIKYPYALNFSNTGSSTYVVSAGGEEGAPGTRPGETVTLTKSGTFDMVRVEIKDADGNDISTTGDIDGTLTFTMPKRDVYIAAYSWSDWPTQGTGTATDPYIISNAEEWKRFANNVSLGRDYSGQYVKLANDISVTQKCGTVSGTTLTKAFSGTFDGDGHTITAAITDTGNQGTALFCYINGATIKNLKVAGAITGGMHAAAIVGTSKGTGNVIEGCVATANVSGGTHIGGILGHGTTSDIAISGCVFSGTMTGGGEAKGALFGWGDNGGTKSVTDCLYVMADGQNTTNLDLVRQYGGAVSVTNCYKTTSAGSYGTQCIFTNSAPSQLGSLVKDYSLVKAYEKALFFDGKYYLSPATSTNAGTEGDPYIINSEELWESFVLWIKEKGDSFTGEYVQLATDITVSTMVGTSEIPFSGTFLGNGHTITANISDTSNDGTALFRNIKGATIKDLTVAGTITGGLHAAAIVGIARGTGNSIRNCVATANVSGGTHIGGILGHATNSDIAISGCVFSGTMTGGAEAKGAIFGWGDNGGTKNVTDCLYLMANGQNTTNLDLVRMNGGTVTVTNSYKTTSAGTYGTHCFSYTFPPATLGDQKQDYGVMTAYEDAIFYDGTYYVAPATLSGSGTETDPYLISNTYEWDSFVRYVNSGTTYSGQYVQLAEDISVSTMVGTSEANSFQGTFLGGGHTITANISDTNNQGTALFRYINGATIKDLTVAGTITGVLHAAAIVGFAQGTGNSIRNCVATANVSGGTHIGGILGHGTTSDIAISGCVFSGTMTGGATAKGAIVGWGESDGTKTVTDCLYLMADGQNTGGLDLVRMNKGTVTVTNSYKTTSAGTYGTHCFPAAVEPANLGDLVQDYGKLRAYQNGVFYAGIFYMVPVSISLADDGDNSTTISEAHGYVADVTLSGRTLYKDGKWNTLCLPFSLSAAQIAAHADFAGATLMTMDVTNKNGFDVEDGTLYLWFKTATEIEAGVPYLVKWTSGDDIINPVFQGVTISNSTAQAVESVTAGLETVQMVGTYSPVSVIADDKSILFLGDANTLYYSTFDRQIRSCRAYFSVPYIKNNAGAKARAFALSFDGEETTGISLTPGPSPKGEGSDYWYTIDGRKLSGKPSQRGMYINKGKKLLVK